MPSGHPPRSKTGGAGGGSSATVSAMWSGDDLRDFARDGYALARGVVPGPAQVPATSTASTRRVRNTCKMSCTSSIRSA